MTTTTTTSHRLDVSAPAGRDPARGLDDGGDPARGPLAATYAQATHLRSDMTANSFQRWAARYAAMHGVRAAKNGNWVTLQRDGAEPVAVMSEYGVRAFCAA